MYDCDKNVKCSEILNLKSQDNEIADLSGREV
jgi:hypothetical protein